MNKGKLQTLRDTFKKGMVLELVRMDDSQAPPCGCRGTVTSVDDMGCIHVDWNNGSSLALIYGTDAFKVVG